MPIVRGHTLEPENIGDPAFDNAERQTFRENTLRSLEAGQRMRMQAAQIMSNLSALRMQGQQREQDRLYDFQRSVFNAGADMAARERAAQIQAEEFNRRQKMDAAQRRDEALFGAELQAERDQRLADQQNFRDTDDFNRDRLLSKEEWVNKGLEEGSLYFHPEQEAERQEVYKNLAKVRTDPRLRPVERQRAESILIDRLNAIEPMPVPVNERPVPTFKQMNANSIRIDPQTGAFEPLGSKPLNPGDVYFVPVGNGRYEKVIHDEEGYKASLKPKETEKPDQLSVKETNDLYNSARQAIIEERKSRASAAGETSYEEPKEEEVQARLQRIISLRNLLFPGAQSAAPQPQDGAEPEKAMQVGPVDGTREYPITRNQGASPSPATTPPAYRPPVSEIPYKAKAERQNAAAYEDAKKNGYIPSDMSMRDFAVMPQDTYLQVVNSQSARGLIVAPAAPQQAAASPSSGRNSMLPMGISPDSQAGQILEKISPYASHAGMGKYVQQLSDTIKKYGDDSSKWPDSIGEDFDKANEALGNLYTTIDSPVPYDQSMKDSLRQGTVYQVKRKGGQLVAAVWNGSEFVVVGEYTEAK